MSGSIFYQTDITLYFVVCVILDCDNQTKNDVINKASTHVGFLEISWSGLLGNKKLEIFLHLKLY